MRYTRSASHAVASSMINPRKLLQERQGHLDLAVMESLKSLESLEISPADPLPGEPRVAYAVDPVWHALHAKTTHWVTHLDLERLCLCLLQLLMSMRKMPTLARQDHVGREALQRKVMGLPLETQTSLWKDLGP